MADVSHEVGGLHPFVEQRDRARFDRSAGCGPVGLQEGLHPGHRIVGAKLGQAQVRQERKEGDDLAVHLDLVLDEHERCGRTIALGLARGHDSSARRRHDRCASPAVEVDARVEKPSRSKREEAGGPLFAAEIGGPPRAQEIVARARNLGEGTNLNGEDEALQRAQDAFPVERARIPLLLV